MNESAEPLAVLVLADDPLALAGLVGLLSGRPRVQVVASGAADDLEGARLLAEPDVLLCDLGGSEGELPDAGFDVPALALVADAERGRLALQSGARGVLLRQADGDRLEAALHAAVEGLRVIDGALSDELFSLGPAPRGLDGLPPLTAREMEVLELLALGLSNREIAEELGVSAHTAKFHIGSILNKMDAQTRTEAVVQAARAGILAI